MQEWYIVGVGKGVLYREVSSVQGCPYIEGFHCTYVTGACIAGSTSTCVSMFLACLSFPDPKLSPV